MDRAGKEDRIGIIKKYKSGKVLLLILGFSVLIQFLLILLITYFVSKSMLIFCIVTEAANLIVILTLINDNRNIHYKLSWICLMLVFPIIGHLMYVLWGRNSVKNNLKKKLLPQKHRGNAYLKFDSEISHKFEQINPIQSRLSKYLETQRFPLFKNNEIQYYPMGENAFEAMIKDMEKANKFILIDFYILAEGTLWEEIHHLLLKKIKAGVQVKLMYDDLGSIYRLPLKFRKRLEAEGFEVGIISPIFKNIDKLYINYRNHNKIVVIDGNYGYTGGINIGDEYINLVHPYGKWKDNAVRVEGDAVWGITVSFLQMWEACYPKGEIDYNWYRPSIPFKENDVFCHFISDGPVNNTDHPMVISFKQIINSAQDYVYIITPYLLIEDDLKEALITAVKSGIDVRIITPKIPDKKIIKTLTNYNYGCLLEAGVKIFEYSPGFIHAKTIINESCGIVGAMNMEYRSFYHHFECGLWMCEQKIINVIKKDIEKVMEISEEVSYAEWLNRPFYLKVIQPVIKLFSVLL